MDEKLFANTIKKYHDSLVNVTSSGENIYKILSDYRDTYIQKQIESEERMINSIFRVFEAVKPERRRKLNINPVYEFSIHNDSLFDYGSIIGYKLQKPWALFNRLIAIQVPFCPNNCWHCYLPKELYDQRSSRVRHVEKTAREIVNLFKQQRDQDRNQGKYSNVLRITGGEPFLLPELILDILQAIQDDGLSEKIFVWTETNLEPFAGPEGLAFMDLAENREILSKISKFNNFCVHPCFHGLSSDEFNIITGKNYSIALNDQIDALKRLVNAGIDVYPTFGINVCDPAHIRSLYFGLKNISDILPLKVALVAYDLEAYPPISERVGAKRTVPLYSKYAAIRIWNQLLLNDFGVGYAVIPRHLALSSNAFLAISGDELKKEREIVYFFKSSARNLYHREILDLLARPSGQIFEITYDKNRVQDDLYFHMGRLSDQYEGKRCIWFYVDRKTSFLIPLRYGVIEEIKNSTDVLAVKVKLNDYLAFPTAGADFKEKIKDALKQYFGSDSIPPRSGKYLLLGEDLITEQLPSSKASCPVISSAFNFDEKLILSQESVAFRKIVDQLIECQDMEKSLFYRINVFNIKKEKKYEVNENNHYEVKGGDSFKIVIDYYLPNYEGFDENQSDQRKIVIESSNSKIQIVGPASLVFSKYGSGEFYLRTESVVHDEEIAINIHSPFDNFKAANIALIIKLKPTPTKNALLSLAGACLLAVGTFGFSMLTQVVCKNQSVWVLTSNVFNQITFFHVIGMLLFLLCFWGVFYIKALGFPVKP